MLVSVLTRCQHKTSHRVHTSALSAKAGIRQDVTRRYVPDRASTKVRHGSVESTTRVHSRPKYRCALSTGDHDRYVYRY
jgi:hypothetical protein